MYCQFFDVLLALSLSRIIGFVIWYKGWYYIHCRNHFYWKY